MQGHVGPHDIVGVSDIRGTRLGVPLRGFYSILGPRGLPLFGKYPRVPKKGKGAKLQTLNPKPLNLNPKTYNPIKPRTLTPKTLKP